MKADLLGERSALEHSIAEYLHERNQPTKINDVIARLKQPQERTLAKIAIRHMLEQGQVAFDNEFRLMLKGE